MSDKEYVTRRTNRMADHNSARELRAVLVSLRDDVETLRAAIENIATKLDSDAGVTDTDYNTLAPVSIDTEK